MSQHNHKESKGGRKNRNKKKEEAQEPKEKEPTTDQPQVETKQLPCPGCNKKFKSDESLAAHKAATGHSEATAKEAATIPPATAMTFDYASALRKGEKKEDAATQSQKTAFQCPQCLRWLSNDNTAWDHAHNSEVPHFMLVDNEKWLDRLVTEVFGTQPPSSPANDENTTSTSASSSSSTPPGVDETKSASKHLNCVAIDIEAVLNPDVWHGDIALIQMVASFSATSEEPANTGTLNFACAEVPEAVATSSLSITYIVDVTALGRDIVRDKLQPMFENPAVPKLFFDVRRDCEALHLQMGIIPRGVFDVQLHDTCMNNTSPPKRRSLDLLCKEHALETSPNDKYSNFTTVKRTMKAAANVPEDGSKEPDGVWNKRPLTTMLLFYAAAGVWPLFQLFNKQRVVSLPIHLEQAKLLTEHFMEKFTKEDHQIVEKVAPNLVDERLYHELLERAKANLISTAEG